MPLIKRDNGVQLRHLIDNTTKHLRALRSLDEPTEYWDTLMVSLITTGLDSATKRDWLNYETTGEFAKLFDIHKFMKKRCDVLESLDTNPFNNQERISNNPRRHSNIETSLHTSLRANCKFCNGDHGKYYGRDFLKLSTENRISEVHKLDICANCLRHGHGTKECISRGYFKCKGHHNTLLHTEKPTTSSNTNVDKDTTVEKHSVNYATRGQPSVLLSTALVQITDLNGKRHTCRALLDSGSTSSFATTNLVNRLKLPTANKPTLIMGFNQSKSSLNQEAALNIYSSHTSFHTKINSLVVPQITDKLPSFNLTTSNIRIPNNFHLADPTFQKGGDIDLLLGSDIFWEIIGTRQVKLGRGKLVLHETKLGWILAGRVHHQMQNEEIQYAHSAISTSDLSKQIHRLELDNVDDVRSNYTHKEQICEQHYGDNYNRVEKQEKINAADTKSVTILTRSCSTKVLGISWNSDQDSLCYSTRNITQDKTCTTRQNLSIISQLFDPLGILGPIIITGKTSNSNISIPTHVLFPESDTIQIHGFADASERAYGARIYLRTKSARSSYTKQLLCAKSRVSTIKTISLPRLELLAAPVLV